jgi:hypothetical protein
VSRSFLSVFFCCWGLWFLSLQRKVCFPCCVIYDFTNRERERKQWAVRRSFQGRGKLPDCCLVIKLDICI